MAPEPARHRRVPRAARTQPRPRRTLRPACAHRARRARLRPARRNQDSCPAGGCVTAVTVDSVTAVDPRPILDDDSRAWLHDLRSDGQAREAALARLHALLLRAA